MIMRLTDNRKDELIDKLGAELQVLRIKAGLSQEELANIIGLSRQTYNSVESKRRKMSWRTCFPLLMYFDNNPRTHDLLRALQVYPLEFVEVKISNDEKSYKKGRDIP